MSGNNYMKNCELGCSHHTCGSIRHIKECLNYPESLAELLNDLKARNKELEFELGQIKISLDYKTKHLASCEKALEGRDSQIGTLCDSHRELEESKGYCCCGGCPLKS